MKTCLISVLLLCAIAGDALGQISFTYDSDGNMTMRSNKVLKSAKITVEEETSEAGEVVEEEDVLTDIATVDFFDKKITIYPNPTHGRINIEIIPFETGKNNFLRLYDMGGNLILAQAIESERSELEITGLPGIYLLDILLGDQLSRWKIIKQ